MPTPTETENILVQAAPEFRLTYSVLRRCVARPGELYRATIADVDRASRVITLKEHKTAWKTSHTNFTTTRRYVRLDETELADAQDLIQ